MDLKESKRREMRALPPDHKWMIIRSQRDREKIDVYNTLF
jgi:hypothetical protein